MRRAVVIGKSIPDGTNQLAQDPSLELAPAITVHRRSLSQLACLLSRDSFSLESHVREERARASQSERERESGGGGG